VIIGCSLDYLVIILPAAGGWVTPVPLIALSYDVLYKKTKILFMEIIDHIAIFKNAVPQNICEDFINFFEDVQNSRIGRKFKYQGNEFDAEEVGDDGKNQFKEGVYGRSDKALWIDKFDTKLTNICYDFLGKAFEQYAAEYPDLQNTPLTVLDVKMQRTDPGGGYHVWHSESSHYTSSNRVLVWMIYLNDIPKGEGETEFFTQRLRFHPERGTILLWPAGYTHAHRGNFVRTTSKYVITGWFIIVNND
jgi:hypothetical protein